MADPSSWTWTSSTHAQRSSIYNVGHYGPSDPRTWPLIHDTKLEKRKGHCKSKSPPPYVAYDAVSMVDLVFHRSTSKIIHVQEYRDNGFSFKASTLFSFKINRQEVLRQIEHILDDEFNFWMRLWRSIPDVLRTSTSCPASETPTRNLEMAWLCLATGRHILLK